ncbi:MAG: S1 RNA-binding domain-containing protein [Lachnospiraceae bacterium]|nr:S1 RNA-binding domain-containing protein [Lachnospiraceae bacterium]
MEETKTTAQVQEEKVETMEDYKDLLEASYRRIRPGDIVTGTVIDVNEKDVIIDFEYYAPGRIPAEEMSNDPTFVAAERVFPGDRITATVIKTDDGAGNMLLSCKDADDTLAWERLEEAKKTKKVYHAKVGGIVKSGVVVYVEGIRAFMPASRLALTYVEDTTPYLNQEIDFIVTEVNEAEKKVIVSARELLQQKAMEEKNKRINKYAVGTIVEGKVEQLKDYGAFVDIGDGISGLLHISQISDKRLKHPSQVLKEGDVIKVKITKIADNKISLSMKEAAEVTSNEVDEDVPEYKDDTVIATGLGALLKGFKLN